mgnify:FL=1
MWNWFLFVSRYLAFKITDMIGFTLAPHWFVKMSFETRKIKKLILDLKRRKMCNLFKKGAKVHFLKGMFFGVWVHFKNFNDLLYYFHLCVFFFRSGFLNSFGGNVCEAAICYWRFVHAFLFTSKFFRVTK